MTVKDNISYYRKQATETRAGANADEESPQGRAARYRKMAERVQRLAEISRFPEVGEQYLGLARQWRTLADAAEHLD